jgi:hypothetical protein
MSDTGRTFVHVSYAYSDLVALRLTAKIYFLTLGRDKIGFTMTGTDINGKPVHIGGPRDSIKRNAVRYYFAIKSFVNALLYPEERRFKMRINEWYNLTSRYRILLFELDKRVMPWCDWSAAPRERPTGSLLLCMCRPSVLQSIRFT